MTRGGGKEEDQRRGPNDQQATSADKSRDDGAPHTPDLNEEEEETAREVGAVLANVIHEVIRREGDIEIQRPTSALAWSGLAAGLSMGFSLVAEALLRSHLPHGAPWAPLVSKIGYSFGFLIVILGRQQLFTENTLTTVLPVLARRDVATFLQMTRVWSVVLLTNLIGAFAVAWVLGNSTAFDEDVRKTFAEIGRKAVEHGWGTIVIRGVFAGWLIAMVVWLLPGSREQGALIILLLTWLVGVGEFSHIIAGSVEAFYLVGTKAIGFWSCIGNYVAPTLIGNVLGGVSLVAVLNHAQVVAGAKQSQHQ